MTIDDGGPAFDTVRHIGDGSAIRYGELTLRDWFAGHAPPMTDQWYEDTKREKLPPGTHYMDAIVSWNYCYADAMLAESRREREDNG